VISNDIAGVKLIEQFFNAPFFHLTFNWAYYNVGKILQKHHKEDRKKDRKKRLQKRSQEILFFRDLRGKLQSSLFDSFLPVNIPILIARI
jgi:hypothetical protein